MFQASGFFKIYIHHGKIDFYWVRLKFIYSEKATKFC